MAESIDQPFAQSTDISTIVQLVGARPNSKANLTTEHPSRQHAYAAIRARGTDTDPNPTVRTTDAD